MALAVASAQAVEDARSTVAAPFPMLADTAHQVAEAYGVYDLLEDGLAAPAVFVIDGDGSIVWSYVGWNASDRPPVADILAQLPP